MKGATELNVTERSNSIFRDRVQLLRYSILDTPGPIRTVTDLIWEYQTVLEDPRLLQNRLDPGVICRLIDLCSGLTQPNQSAFNLHVRIWAVNNWRVFQQLRKEERILAYPLDGLLRSAFKATLRLM